MNFKEYQSVIIEDIHSCLEGMNVQPILFFGSGMSQRYIGTPSWNGLLENLINICPNIDKSIAYYRQKYQDPIAISSAFSEYIREWAWNEQDLFPSDLFEADQTADIYIKHSVSEIFNEVELDIESKLQSECFLDELASLKAINPYALITTNYDSLLENLFPDFTPVVGQEVLHANFASVGEIIKIHGCATQPESIVLTQDDYDHFAAKKKYLSAKLLTYFAEHPLFIMGYSAQDPNIKAILSDIDEILSAKNQLIPNIYLIERNQHAESTGKHAREKLIQIDSERSVRVKSISANCFKWIYDALGSSGTLDSISPKLLRAVLARTYNLIRHDIPTKTVEVDFQMLEHAVSSGDDFAKLYGITNLNNPSALNASYPFTITNVAAELGYNHWHHVNVLINSLNDKEQTNIKLSDNKYHIAIKVGNRVQTHKYSQALVDLLKKLKQGESYQFEP